MYRYHFNRNDLQRSVSVSFTSMECTSYSRHEWRNWRLIYTGIYIEQSGGLDVISYVLYGSRNVKWTKHLTAWYIKIELFTKRMEKNGPRFRFMYSLYTQGGRIVC